MHFSVFWNGYNLHGQVCVSVWEGEVIVESTGHPTGLTVPLTPATSRRMMRRMKMVETVVFQVICKVVWSPLTQWIVSLLKMSVSQVLSRRVLWVNMWHWQPSYKLVVCGSDSFTCWLVSQPVLQVWMRPCRVVAGTGIYVSLYWHWYLWYWSYCDKTSNSYTSSSTRASLSSRHF